MNSLNDDTDEGSGFPAPPLIPRGQQISPVKLAEWIDAQDDPIYMVVTDSGYIAAHLSPDSAHADYIRHLEADTDVHLVRKARKRSRQKKHGGGKFYSERQRKFMWAVVPKAAKKWAHNRKTRKGDWRGANRSIRANPPRRGTKVRPG